MRSDLRTGWTTGACAAAAAKAATACLVTGQPGTEVKIVLPSGQGVSFAVARCALLSAGARAEAVVVKDAGDDPDATNGANVTATVEWTTGAGITITGGSGVGVVTKEGLGLPLGQAAINPVPRQMITQAVGAALAADTSGRGVLVTISVPGGEAMARKTTNARLGILGGISILGTTGIVQPFSTESWRASVEQAVRVYGAHGGTTLVLCTGRRTERAAAALHPDLPDTAFVEVGDFVGAALRAIAGGPVTSVYFFGMIGKLTKLAAGVLMTHYTGSTVEPAILGEITRAAGGAPALAAAVGTANTGRHGYELWAEAGLLRTCGDLLCATVADILVQAAAAAGAVITAEVAMVNFLGDQVVAATVPTWVAE